MDNCYLLKILKEYKSEKFLNRTQCIFDKLNKVYGKDIKSDNIRDSDKFELYLNEIKSTQGNNMLIYGIAIAMFSILIALFQIFLNNKYVVELDICRLFKFIVLPIAFLSLVYFALLYTLLKPNFQNQNINYICYLIKKYYTN